jgi:hypothetical protein
MEVRTLLSNVSTKWFTGLELNTTGQRCDNPYRTIYLIATFANLLSDRHNNENYWPLSMSLNH